MKIEIEKPTYAIGVDTYNKDAMAYCLIMSAGEETTIIMIKSISGEKKFWKEVKNLALYFDAKIVKES